MADTQTADAQTGAQSAVEAPKPDVAQATPSETSSSGPGQPAAVDVREPVLPERAPSQNATGGGQIDLLLDAPLPVWVRLGEADVRISELLSLGEGSVLKLDKQAGEPVDLFLRGVRFAAGQLVTVGEHLGVRITQILPAPTASPDKPA